MKSVILYIFKDKDKETINHVMKEFLMEWLGVDGFSMVVGDEK
jgi:hypothetical protein